MSTSKTIESILEEIKIAQAAAAIEPELATPNTRPSLYIAKQQGINDLVRLKREYLSVLTQETATVFAYDNGSTVVDACKDVAVVFDARRVYQEITQPVYENMCGTGNFLSEQYVLLVALTRGMAVRLDTRIPVIDFEGPRFLSTPTELETYVEQLITKSIGNQMLCKYALETVANAALGEPYNGKPTAIVIINAKDHEREDLSRVFTKVRALDADFFSTLLSEPTSETATEEAPESQDEEPSDSPTESTKKQRGRPKRTQI